MQNPAAVPPTPDNSRYAWADYLHCMDGLPDTTLDLPVRKAAKHKAPYIVWGVIGAVVLAVASLYLSEAPFAPFTINGNRHPIEPVMVAIVLGILLANTVGIPKLLVPGLKFTAKKLLPLAIILLGAKLDFMQIVAIGGVGVGLSIGTILLGIGIFLLFIRWGLVQRRLGLLLGIGTAICGGTAIVAAAPILEAEDEEVAFGVATVNLLGLVAMFLLPIAAHAMNMSDRAFGFWAGLSIHPAAQVIAAGYAYSPAAGPIATIVKLSRICMLAPVLLVISLQLKKEKKRHGAVSASPPRKGGRGG